MEDVKVAVIAATPGADTNDYVMFDSTVTFAAPNASNSKSTTLAAHDISRVLFGLKNSHLGTLKVYRSTDKGTNWDQYGGDVAVPASPSTDISGPYDLLVDFTADCKVIWTNGGSAQTTWRPEVVLLRGYHGAAT